MSTYVTLGRFTDQGMRDIKNLPQRLLDSSKSIEAAGGRLVDFYMIMGEYDYVAIIEAPSDEFAMTLLFETARGGSARTTTFKAFTRADLERMVEKLS